MPRSMIGLCVVALLAVGPGTPVAGQSLDRQGLWCGEDPTLPTERPALENPEALDQLGDRLSELLNPANRSLPTLFFRDETGEVRPLEGVVSVDVWFCVDTSGSVTHARTSGLGTGLEPGLNETVGGLQFRPSTRDGIPRTGVATLTFLLATGETSVPKEIIGRHPGTVLFPWGELFSPSRRPGEAINNNGGR